MVTDTTLAPGRGQHGATLAAVAVAVAVAASAAVAPAASAQGGWRVGDIVGLRAGTCIRVGPGFGYRAHTRVPEDDWAVKVIDGPRGADGLTWFDTSRREAGDPSGGTGWVAESQTDRACALDGSGPTIPGRNFLQRLLDWWRAQDQTGKWVAAIVALAVAVWAWQRLAMTVFAIARMVILGLILWWLADQTRSSWQPTWSSMAGADAPDPAVLVAFLPALSWVVARLGGRRR